MSFARQAGGAIVFAATLAAGASVQAGERVAITYSGTAWGIYDPSDVFGLSGVRSAAYVDTYVFDLGLGSKIINASDSDWYGGSLWGNASPLVDSKITINGVTVDFPGGGADSLLLEYGLDLGADADTRDPVLGWWGNYNTIAFNAPTSLGLGFSGSSTDPNESWGYFFKCSVLGYSCPKALQIFSGNLAPDTVTVSVLSVPEPASWALLFSGFFGLGAALRRRRAIT